MQPDIKNKYPETDVVAMIADIFTDFAKQHGPVSIEESLFPTISVNFTTFYDRSAYAAITYTNSAGQPTNLTKHLHLSSSEMQAIVDTFVEHMQDPDTQVSIGFKPKAVIFIHDTETFPFNVEFSCNKDAWELMKLVYGNLAASSTFFDISKPLGFNGQLLIHWLNHDGAIKRFFEARPDLGYVDEHGVPTDLSGLKKSTCFINPHMDQMHDECKCQEMFHKQVKKDMRAPTMTPTYITGEQPQNQNNKDNPLQPEQSVMDQMFAQISEHAEANKQENPPIQPGLDHISKEAQELEELKHKSLMDRNREVLKQALLKEESKAELPIDEFFPPQEVEDEPLQQDDEFVKHIK